MRILRSGFVFVLTVEVEIWLIDEKNFEIVVARPLTLFSLENVLQDGIFLRGRVVQIEVALELKNDLVAAFGVHC